MSNQATDPTDPGPGPEPSPAVAAARRWGWALWGLPGIFIMLGGLLLPSEELSPGVLFVGLGVIALTPLAAAGFDGRRRTALALVVSLGLVTGLTLFVDSLSPGNEYAQLGSAIARRMAIYGMAIYTAEVAAVFGVAWLVRWFLRRSRPSAVADALPKA